MPTMMPGPAPIAVVGMHGRFPGAADLRTFWQHLLDGRDAVDLVPAERWRWQDYDSELSASEESTYAHRGGFMAHVDRFDHRFFGILPREAQVMDPQQRLFLQAAWAALEDAGYAPSRLARHRVGVFVGVGHADYPVLMRRDAVPSDPWRGTGIALTAIANRVSFALDLHGPSESIDTACSSSLVAIHRASQALRAGECDLAIVGGVNLLLGPELFIAFAKAGMLSQTGHCQTFDAGADGYVRGEGVAALVLAPLAAAQANGDYVYGEICGSAQNHGGRAHSFTAPNPKAQAEVIGQAWQQAGRSLRQAALIETHGTGTPLGDPIEINALKSALAQAAEADGEPPARIALGALKSHIGHLEAAAGIASVIKALASLGQRRLVGNLHFRTLNPHIQLDDTPFYLPTAAAELPAAAGAERLAGVSAFGFAGVNAHVVLKAHDEPDAPAAALAAALAAAPAPYLILLSARDAEGLQARARQLLELFAEPLPAPVEQHRQRLLERLHALLGLAAPEAGAPAIALAGLAVSAPRFVACLEQAIEELQLDVEVDAWRGAVTLDEVAQRLAAEAGGNASAAAPAAGLPLLAASQLAEVDLARIARSLQDGRDAMGMRLALVAESRAQLFELLREFLRNPAGHHAELFVSTAGQAPAAQPQDFAQRASASQLREWAAYWTTHKNAASPEWRTLYGDEPPPRKIPLPAYPFRLDRVWYRAPDQAPATVAMAPLSPAEAWSRCWAGAEPLPGSPMALACVIERGLAASPARRLRWTEIQFGQPRALAADQAIGCTPLAAAEVQTVQATIGDHVLLQAEQQAGVAPLPPAALPAFAGRAEPGEAFYAALAASGLDYRQSARCVRRFEASATQLLLGVQLACADHRDPRFWAELLATLTGALALLDRAPRVALPYRIGSLDLDREALDQLRTLQIARCAATGRFALGGFSASGAKALAIEGLEVRAWQAGFDSAAAQRESA